MHCNYTTLSQADLDAGLCVALVGVDALLLSGCWGQIPEITDGDAPHTPRGCDAQAWSITETLRVWRLLQE